MRCFSSYIRQFTNGITVVEFCTSLATSYEFRENRRHLSEEEWADELYRKILEREPDQVGRTHTILAIENSLLANRAAEMLDAAGWKKGADGIRQKNGVKLQFSMSTTAGSKAREQAQALIQANWKEIGVAMEIKNMPASVVWGEYTAATWQ